MSLTPFAKRAIIFLAFLLLGWVTGQLLILTIIGLVVAAAIPGRFLQKDERTEDEKVREAELDVLTSRSRKAEDIGPEALLQEITEELVHLRLAGDLQPSIIQKAEKAGKKAIDLTSLLYQTSEYGNSQLLATFQSLSRKRLVETLQHYRQLSPQNRRHLAGQMEEVLEEIERGLTKVAERAAAKQLEVSQDKLIDTSVFTDLESKMTDLQ